MSQTRNPFFRFFLLALPSPSQVHDRVSIDVNTRCNSLLGPFLNASFKTKCAPATLITPGMRRRERGRADAAFVFQLAGSFKHLFFFILSNQWFRLPTRLVTPGYRDRSRVCPICSVFLSIWKKKSLKYKCSGKRISTWRIHSGYILINIIMNIVDLSLEKKKSKKINALFNTQYKSKSW